jgi:hypothetical protein
LSINITTIGAAGVHTLRPVNVNAQDNYIYFKNEDVPSEIIEEGPNQSFIYSDGIGSIEGPADGSLVYVQRVGDNLLKLVDGSDPETAGAIDIVGFTAGGIALNNPVIVDNKISIGISTPSNQAVKYFTTGTPITGLVSGNTYFLKNIPADFRGVQSLYDLEQGGTPDTFTFTTAFQTGREGPTHSQVLNSYSSAWHNNPPGANRFLKPGAFRGYQDWVVPVSGIYDFDVRGAASNIPAQRINLAYNPSLESDATGWTVIGSGTTGARITTDAKFGSASFEVTKGAVANAAGVFANASGARIPVSPNTSYTASAWVKVPTGQQSGSFRIRRVPYTAVTDGTALSQSAGTATAITSDNGWVRLSMSFTTTSDTNAIAFRVEQSTTGTAGQKFLIDGLLVEQTTALLPYFDGGFYDDGTAIATTAWTGAANNSTSTATLQLSSGRGARVKGKISLTQGEIITIVVGQLGVNATSNSVYGGSGGGTFVVRKQGSEPLFIAGGGSSLAGPTNGQDGRTTTRGGTGTFGGAGGTDGFGGRSGTGRTGGGGGFFSRGENAVFGVGPTTQPGGGAFVDGLTASSIAGGAQGGFGGGAAGNSVDGQSGGGGGYSGGAGSLSASVNTVGGGGGSFITSAATDVQTSDGQYEEINLFNNVPISNLSSYNNSEGSVTVSLIESFTSGNSVHPTAQDAEDGTNAIAIAPAGNSFHSFVPINYDIQNDRIHFTSEHGFVNGQAIAFNFEVGTPDLSTLNVYYVNKINDFTIGLVFSPAVNFTTPTTKSSSDVIRKIVVNVDLDSLNIPSHGFSFNQPIQYSAGGGTPIQAGGVSLDENATYYVAEVIDQDNFKLKNALNSPTVINFTAPGTGTSHSFTFLTVNLIEDTLYIPSHNLVSGQSVSYNTNGGTPVGGLTQGQSYFVNRVDSSTISLHNSAVLDSSTRVNLTSAGTGTHSLIIASIDFATETITIPAHGFLQGELVEYDSRGQTEIAGLETNQQYYIILVDANNIKLATTAENAESGTAINLLASPAGVGKHTLSSLQQTPDGIYTIRTQNETPPGVPTDSTFNVTARGTVSEIVKIFDPRQTVDIELDALFFPSHGFITGTKVTYNKGDNANDVGGLVSTTDYYVVAINQDYFRLASTLENALSGVTLDLTSFGSANEHRITSNQLNGRKVGSGNVSVIAGSVLVDGVGTSFAKILKVGDPFVLYPPNITNILTFKSDDVNTGNNRIEKAHNFAPGEYVKFNTGGGTSPVPLQPNYYYYVGVVNETAIQLFTSYAAAIALTGPITFSSQGTGNSFTLTNTIPSGPIVRRITAVGSDIQVTVDRPYSTAYTQVAYAYPTFMYVRPSGFALHRPFDGGVEMSSGSSTWFGQIIRQTRKYFRYQSGKGIQTSFAITYKPSIDIESMTRLNPTQVRVTTRRPHNLISGLTIRVAEAENSQGATSTLYNGNFQVIVDDLTTFRILLAAPEGAESKAYGFPQFHVTSWSNGAIRSGMFDFQNGLFFEFDGQKLYAVRRSSTQQAAGFASALRGSELVFGDRTQFTSQFDEGDFVVMRGQTYRIIDIQDDTTMSVRPEYRGSTGVEITFDPATQLNLANNTFTVVRHGLSQNLPVIYNSIDGEPLGGLINGRTYYADVINSNNFRLFATPSAGSNVNLSSVGTTNIHSFIPAQSGIILTKTVDTRIPQEEWNIDKCDGTGPSGYNLDLSRIQMCYIDYSWYGAGKVRFGLKTGDGLVRYVHEFKHNNILFESYFRSGNLPARYEVATFENPTYVPSLFHWGTSVIMDGTFDDDRGYLFTAGSQTLDIEGTTTKSFAGTGIDLETDLITSLTHGFKSADIVQFQSIAADGLPGLNSQNPDTRVVGSNTLDVLENTTKYGILVNSPDRIHLTPPTAKFTFGATVSRSAGVITVTTPEPHGIPNGAYVGIYGLTATNLVNGAFTVAVTNSTTFTYTVPGSFTVSSILQPDAAIAEVIDFTTRGNVQYTFFLHPDGSLNNTSGPNYQPLISLRLSPSADSGLTGRLGDKDIINRMQVRMQEIGVSPDELVEVKLLLNGRLNNLGFTPVDSPSLVEIVEHTLQDTISGGIQIYNFQAEAGSTTTLALDTLFELSNSILGGDNVFPDGPDILTVAVSRLTGNPTRTSAKLSWLEAQA